MNSKMKALAKKAGNVVKTGFNRAAHLGGLALARPTLIDQKMRGDDYDRKRQDLVRRRHRRMGDIERGM